MNEFFSLIAEVGMPIASALASGFFVYVVIKQLLSGVISQIETLTTFCKSLENRSRMINNQMIKIDMLISTALELRPDIERMARAENYIEDGKLDVRRD